MPKSAYDVGVIGLGVMGCAAAWRASLRGLSVVGFDTSGIPNTTGSSHGQTRAIRQAYAEHQDYVPLLKRSYDLWRELESVSHERILTITGGLYTGPSGCDLVEGSRRAAFLHGLPHEFLEVEEMRARWPQADFSDEDTGLYEPAGGIIYAERAVTSMAASAIEAGADLRTFEEVTAWRKNESGFTLETRAGTVEVERLIVTTGPWMTEIARELKVRLKVTRQAVGFVWPSRPTHFLASTFPVLASEIGGRFFYSLPIAEGSGGLKVAQHEAGVETPPGGVDRKITEEDRASFQPLLDSIYARADAQLLNVSTCLYSNSLDGHFVIDRHPGHENLALAFGFSGHGFKFAPIVGEALTDLALDGKSPLPIDFLGLSRFQPSQSPDERLCSDRTDRRGPPPQPDPARP